MSTDLHNEFLGIAGGDPRMARLLHDSLKTLSEGPNELLREMAESVLRGQVSLQQAVASQVYGEALGDTFIQFQDEYHSKDPEQTTEAVEKTREYLSSLPSDGHE